MQINLNNYWRGYWPQHPVQLHMHVGHPLLSGRLQQDQTGAPGIQAAMERARRAQGIV
jgi:hypothetical protein